MRRGDGSGLGWPGDSQLPGLACRFPRRGRGTGGGSPGRADGCVSLAGEEAEAGGGHGSHKKKHKKHKKKHKKKHHHEAAGPPPPPPAPEPTAGLRKPQLKLKIKLGGQILGTKR